MVMIKVTYPIWIGDRHVLPGEVVQVEDDLARAYFTQEWAIPWGEEIKPAKRGKKGGDELPQEVN